MQYPYPYGPAPTPPKQGMGCIPIALIVVGVLALGTVIFIAIVVSATKKSPEEQRRLDEELAAAQAAASAQNAAIRAKFEGEVRAGCKLAPTAPVFVVDDADQIDQCRAMIREGLKVPGSADFPGPSDDTRKLISDDGCNRIYQSYVDAQNAFGVKVRTRYECKFDPRTGLYKAKTLN